MNNSVNQNNRGLTVAGLLVIVALVGLVALMLFGVNFRTVEGNEIGVKETWAEGVIDTPLTPKTYVLFPAFNQKVYTYPTSGQVFVMNDKDDKAEPFAQGRHSDALLVTSLDNQKVSFHVTVTWRIDPKHVVNLHKNYRDNIEERLIRPEIVNAVAVRATLQTAIDLYSGPKLNALREAVTNELRSADGKLATSGVVVDRFVIEKPKLNPEYEKVIEARQLAIAQESQAREQKKTNEAIAEAAKAAALKQQFEEVVKADTAAKKAVIETKAEADNNVTRQQAVAQVLVINAKAEAEKQVALSEAAKQAEINRAVGIEAIGKAEAEAKKLGLSAFAVPGAESFVKVEVAKNLGIAFQNVKGYLPANVNYSTVGADFSKAVNVLVGETPAK